MERWRRGICDAPVGILLRVYDFSLKSRSKVSVTLSRNIIGARH